MTSRTEKRPDHSESREESLGVPGRLQATHPPFPLAGGLMGILHPIIQPALLLVLHRRHYFYLGRRIAAEFVGDDRSWDVLKSSTACERTSWRPVCSAATERGCRAHRRPDRRPATVSDLYLRDAACPRSDIRTSSATVRSSRIPPPHIITLQSPASPSYLCPARCSACSRSRFR
jgi:hypothetical protein